MQKEYGKLTTNQFRELLSFMSPLLDMIQDMEKLIGETPKDKREKVLTGDFGAYCVMYEVPLNLHVATLVVALNRQEDVSQAAAADDPQEAVLNWMKTDDDADRPHNEAFEVGEVIALSYSVARSFFSVATYGRSISGLLEDAREGGDQDALFKAVRMDRAVIGCPTAMRFIAEAQMSGDKKFFRRLANALEGPSKKQMAPLNRMRYAFVLLREMGLDNLSQAELAALMVEKLDVYAPGTGNAEKNLWAHYTESRKRRSI